MPTHDDRIAIGRISLGVRIRNTREKAGISLAATARAAAISYSYLSDVERGRRLPTIEVLDSIASALDTSVVRLLTGLYPWDDVQRPRLTEPPPDARRKDQKAT